MFCQNCGAQNPDNARVCGNCGQVLTPVQPQQPQYQQPQYAQPQQPQYQQPQYAQPQQPQYQPPQYAQQAQQQFQNFRNADPKGWYNGHPMGWYKFLIYFLLFASAVLNVIMAIVYFSGGQYTYNGYNISSAVYAYYPGLHVVDIIYGIAALGLAAFAIVTRNALAGLKVSGPKFVLYMYAASAAINFLYAVLALIIAGSDALSWFSIIFSIIYSAVLIYLNKVYFDKRKELFVR